MVRVLSFLLMHPLTPLQIKHASTALLAQQLSPSASASASASLVTVLRGGLLEAVCAALNPFAAPQLRLPVVLPTPQSLCATVQTRAPLPPHSGGHRERSLHQLGSDGPAVRNRVRLARDDAIPMHRSLIYLFFLLSSACHCCK